MDNLVLTRIGVDLAASLVGAEFAALRQETQDRFRLEFAVRGGVLHLVVSLRPGLPWIGTSTRRWNGPRWSPDPFTVAAARALVGRRVVGVSKAPADRALRLDLGGGRGLVAELATHGANLVHLAAGGVVDGALRRPKGSHSRLEPGSPWVPREVPPGKLDPFGMSAEGIDEALAHRTRNGESAFESLRRDVLGVGSVGAALVLDEAAASGRTPGAVLRERLAELQRGDTEVVIEGPVDPALALEKGAFDPARFRLLPWRPLGAASDTLVVAREDAAATAGLFHETVEAHQRLRDRIAALGAILRGELRRTRAAGSKVRQSLRAFDDPERYRRMAEALLAGLGAARREGDTVFVPDPYDEQSRPMAIPARPGRPLPQVANELFHRQRRARRGLETAGARAEALDRRADRLEELLARHERATREADAAELESAMRAERLAVGLSGPTRASRAAAALAAPKLEGVRMVTSGDGWTILVGRTGRDNDRLTFKIAAPDDFWLHAEGVSGAHVVIRNPDRKPVVPESTLAEAARLAAWFSDARRNASVDVQWTRRKNVRRARGGTSGTVVLKRFQTLRVRPEPPGADD